MKDVRAKLPITAPLCKISAHWSIVIARAGAFDGCGAAAQRIMGILDHADVIMPQNFVMLLRGFGVAARHPLSLSPEIQHSDGG